MDNSCNGNNIWLEASLDIAKQCMDLFLIIFSNCVAWFSIHFYEQLDQFSLTL